MQTAIHILSMLIILALLATGVPYFRPHQGTVSDPAMLADAVASIQDLAKSGLDNGGSTSEIKKALSSLYVAAGLKTVIKADKDGKAVSNHFSSDSLYIVSDSVWRLTSYCNERISAFKILYQSLTITPIPPPPRFAFSKAFGLMSDSSS